jgi:hypothetical protein
MDEDVTEHGEIFFDVDYEIKYKEEKIVNENGWVVERMLCRHSNPKDDSLSTKRLGTFKE